jgi:deoxyribodipyrimidine photo-lyase
LPDEFIHAPWEAPPLILTNARVRLGENYPHPIILPEQGRDRALAAYERMKLER